MLRRYWGRMIELGATTVWEGFELDWPLAVHQHPPQPYGYGATSLCQPAGSGPVEWLMREILGVKPGSPGFDTLILQPHQGALSWARGTVPTPKGQVEVYWRVMEEGRFRIDFTVPNGIAKTVLCLPSGRRVEIDHRKEIVREFSYVDPG